MHGNSRRKVFTKVFISLFIVFSFFVQIDFQRGCSMLDPVIEPWLRKIFPFRLRSWLADYLNEPDRFRYFGSAAGLFACWRMFSPTVTTVWRYRYTGIHSDGSRELLPLPHQSPRDFLRRNFIDFREVKLEINLPFYSGAHYLYAMHQCRAYSDPLNPIAAVEVVSSWTAMHSADEARASGSYFSPAWSHNTIGVFECRGR